MTLEAAFKSGDAVLVVDGAAGIYAPQHLVEQVDVIGVDACVVEDVGRGPEDNEFYEESWDQILQWGVVLVGDETYRIHQDQDVWLVRDGVEIEDWS